MYKIVIIGCGRLGRQLALGLSSNGNPPVQLFNRTYNRGKKVSAEVGIPFTDRWEEIIPRADLYILAVSDHAIPAVSGLISKHIREGLVVHTSGNTSIKVLSNDFDHYGLFYPLDTYNDEIITDFAKVPFILNAETESDLEILSNIAKILSSKIVTIADEQMPHLHLAAVFANNFSNKIIDIAFEILKEKNIPKEVLVPLIETTFRNALDNGPKQSQTGPAVRNDVSTIQDHRALLEHNKELKEVYTLLSQLINSDLKGKI